MKTVYLTFDLHLANHLKKIRFWEIGRNPDYFDHNLNRETIEFFKPDFLYFNLSLQKVLEDLKGKVQVNFCISGTTLELFHEYAPELIISLQTLTSTGFVEFIGTTYSNSLAALSSRNEFKSQIIEHKLLIQDTFGKTPDTFKIFGYLFSDKTCKILKDLDFENVLIQGRMPDQMIKNLDKGPKAIWGLNFIFSDYSIEKWFQKSLDIHPLWEIYTHDLNKMFISNPSAQIGIILKYTSLAQTLQSSYDWRYIRQFFNKTSDKRIRFQKLKNIGPINTKLECMVDEKLNNTQNEGQLFQFKLSNPLQKDAHFKLFQIEELVNKTGSDFLTKKWRDLQSIDYFMLMQIPEESDNFSDKDPYEDQIPFQAYINYMNILSDLKFRIDQQSQNRYTTTPFSIKN